MDNESLKRRVLSDMNMKENMIADLQRELQEEMNKPSAQWDCYKISEITETIHNLSCDGESGTANESGKQALLEKARSSTVPTKKKIYRRIGAAAACLLIGVGLNAASLSAFGTNMFSAAYQISQGSVSIDMGKTDIMELSQTSDDPYGMKAKCAEYDMYPLTPSYIPEGFELVDLYEEKNSTFTNIIFLYKKGNVKLNFDICQYNEGETIPPIGIPTDTYNIIEQEIDGLTMYIMKEDNQFIASFLNGRTVYVIASDGLNYDECYKVVGSLVK